MNRTREGGLSRWLSAALCLIGLLLGAAGAGAVEQVVYYHTDALGSPVAGTDAAGRLLWRESYLPQGERRTYASRETQCSARVCRPMESQADEKVWYTGKLEEPGVGLVYLGARWYDPELGRFLSPDPAGYDPGVYESFNRYAYGNNNPYKYTDPDGRNASLALGGIAYESWQWLQGNGFDGGSVLGALADGYNGEGDGFLRAAGEDALNFGGGLGRASGTLLLAKMAEAAKAAEAVADVGKVAHSAGKIGETDFKTGHYVPRLEKAGVDVKKAESAVSDAVQAMRKDMAVGADVRGRMTIDNKLIEYRAMLLEDGTVNVGTIFPVVKTP
jgi:RHS repeat-associated protein